MKEQKNTIRQRADEVKDYRCKNLIAVIEEPSVKGVRVIDVAV
jgi:tRNA (guanosine-2'-O-)-methyltransferase